MFWLKKRVVGVDIGATGVKVMVAKKVKDRHYLLEKLGVAPLPEGVVVKGSILNRSAVTHALQEAIQQAGITLRQAALTVGSQQVVLRHVELPKMKEEEIREALRWEMDQYVPIPASEAVFDYLIVGERMKEGVMQWEILLIAAPAKVVEEYVLAVKEAGLDPVAVDIEPLAVARVLRHHARLNQEVAQYYQRDNIIVLDFGHEDTKMTLYRRGYPEMFRIINTGIFTLQKNIATVLNVSLGEAEQLLVRYGLTETVPDELERAGRITLPDGRTLFDLKAFNEAAYSLDLSTGEKKQPVSLQKELFTHLDELLREVRRSVEYFRLQYRGEEVSRILLLGGGAGLKGLREMVEDSLDIPTSIYSPLEMVEPGPEVSQDLSQMMPRLVQVLGLAMREGE